MDRTVKARLITNTHTETALSSREPMQQIKLMKFLTVFGFGGTERQVVTLVRMLDRSRFDPRFACLRRWGHFLNEIENVCQIPVSEYPITNLYKPDTFWQQYRLAREMRQHGTQIVHSYNFYANVFAVPAAKLAGVPVVIASVRDTGMGITSAKMRLHKLVCSFADCILVNAEAVRQWLIADGWAADKIVVIRNGIDLSLFTRTYGENGLRAELGIPANAPLVTVLARLAPQKGIESFLEAAAVVHRYSPEARFLIVGDVFVYDREKKNDLQSDVVYQHALKSYAERLGIGDRVIFTGYRADVPGVLSQATVSVLPSLSGEGLSNTLLESMAVGTPVVATTVGGNAEVIEDRISGLLVPPREPDALAQAICAILQNPELAQRLGRAAKRRVTQLFSRERMVRETQDLYMRLLEKNTNGGVAEALRQTRQ
jgi:L-malate glycosyltransferase